MEEETRRVMEVEVGEGITWSGWDKEGGKIRDKEGGKIRPGGGATH